MIHTSFALAPACLPAGDVRFLARRAGHELRFRLDAIEDARRCALRGRSADAAMWEDDAASELEFTLARVDLAAHMATGTEADEGLDLASDLAGFLARHDRRSAPRRPHGPTGGAPDGGGFQAAA